MSRRKWPVSKRYFLRLYGAALVVAACGQDATAPPPPLVAYIEVTPATASVVIGHTLQLTAKARDAAGNELGDRPITWTSNAETQATVSAVGSVQALALSDTVLITATSDGKSARARLIVVIDINGEWNFTEQFSQSFGAVSCSDTGSYQFTQTGENIAGSSDQIGTCISQSPMFSSADNTILAIPLSGGRLSSAHISFGVASTCAYDATVTAQPAPKLSGTLSCTGGNTTGTWEATPGGAPVATVEVRSDVQTVVGGVVQMVAVVRDAAGHVLSRPVQWASNNPTAFAVSGEGLVMAHAAGAAHITATTEGTTGSATITADPVTFTMVNAGIYHNCALTPAGAAYCWGWGGDGQLGTGFRRPATAPPAAAQTPVAVAGGHAFAVIATGYQHSCGVTTGGETYCWGGNSTGQLGNGSTTSSLAPTPVSGGLQFASVTAGVSHSCGRTVDNAAYCWGDNSGYQLGSGGFAPSTSPVPVAGGLLFQTVRAGFYHTCGVTSASAAVCWGDNLYGQLGDSTTSSTLTPVAVSGGHPFSTVAGGLLHSCGVSPGGTAYCWGYNGQGELGDGTGVDDSVPVLVSGGLSFATGDTSLTAGNEHSCALTPAGAAYCWGLNFRGELGNGSTDGTLVPVPVSGGLTFGAISAGPFHTCGVSSALVYCWGQNANGELGRATSGSCGSVSCATTPAPVTGQPGAGALFAVRSAAAARDASPSASLRGPRLDLRLRPPSLPPLRPFRP